MDTPIKVAIIAGSVAVISTILTNLLASRINWGIAKKKEALEYKRQLINQWREMVGRVMTTYYAEYTDEENSYAPFRYIVQDRAFYSLKVYLSKENIREIEDERDYHILSDMLQNEISRIEASWNLFPVVDHLPTNKKRQHR